MGKVLSCYWNLQLNGVELDKKRKECIESIEIEENCDGSDTASLIVNDPDFFYIEDNIYVEEATINVSIGWHGDSHRVNFAGYISAIDINFPETGFPVISLFCLDCSHVMNRVKKSRSWDDVTRADVVRIIAQEYGFSCNIESGYDFKQEDTISQSNATDIEFLESLAGEEREPFICKLMGTTIHYVKKGLLQTPVATMYYKRFPYDVKSFSPKINKETRQVEVTAGDVNTNNKTVDIASASDDTTEREVQGDSVKTLTYDAKTGVWR